MARAIFGTQWRVPFPCGSRNSLNPPFWGQVLHAHLLQYYCKQTLSRIGRMKMSAYSDAHFAKQAIMLLLIRVIHDFFWRRWAQGLLWATVSIFGCASCVHATICMSYARERAEESRKTKRGVGRRPSSRDLPPWGGKPIASLRG